MTRFITRFQSHPVHQLLVDIDSLLGKVDTKSLNDKMLQDFLRLQQLQQYVKEAFKRVDPQLVPLKLLDLMKAPLSGIASNLKAFQLDKIPVHFEGANDQYDNVIFELSRLPIIMNKSQGEALSKSVTPYLTEYEKVFNQIKLINSSFEQDVSKKSSDFTVKLQTISEKEVALSQEIENLRVNVRNEMMAYKKQFDDSQAKRDKIFEEKLDKKIKEIEKVEGNLNYHEEKVVKQTEYLINNFYTKLNNYEEEARKLLSVIGDIGLVGSYKNYANEEKKLADDLRVIGAMAILGGALLAAALTKMLMEYNVSDWNQLLMKLPLFLLFVFPAIYAFRESSKHREASFRYRKKQLELAALGPYISDLQKGKQEELKSGLAEKFFGNEEVNGKSEDYVPIVSSMKDLIKELGELVKNLKPNSGS